MTARHRSIAAIALLGLTIACIVVAAAMPDDDWPLFAILALGSVLIFATAVGTLIAVRAGGNRVGWVLIGIGLSVSSGMFATQYANRALVDAPRSLPFGGAIAWLQSWLWSPILGLFAWLVLWFPTGRPPSPRWRIVGTLALVTMVIATGSVAFRPGTFDTFPHVHNPLGVAALGRAEQLVDVLINPLVLLTYAAVVASIVVRFRRARGTERQQLKWFAYAVGGALALTAGSRLDSIGSATGRRSSSGRSAPCSPSSCCRSRSGRRSSAIASTTSTGSSAGRCPTRR